MEKAFENSIFEYKIIHIVLIDKESNNYLKEKNKCPNIIIKILFHGTDVKRALEIISTQFNDARVKTIGDGVYFTDILDYVWYYSGEIGRFNFKKIPEVEILLLLLQVKYIMININ